MARASTEGHRVVLVVATNGEHGEVPDDLADGETLVDRRRRETECSAEVLGVHHVLWLGYSDSGMTGWDQNTNPDSFWQADVDDAGARLAKLLEAEHADVLVTYDWHGGYGHPDHVQAHRGRPPRPAARPAHAGSSRRRSAGTPCAPPPSLSWARSGIPTVPPTTATRSARRRSRFTTPSTCPTSSNWRKRRALSCHASQTSDAGAMLAMPEEMFARIFGTEWFIEPGRPPGTPPRLAVRLSVDGSSAARHHECVPEYATIAPWRTAGTSMHW